MRKEELLNKKKEIVKNMEWSIRSCLSDEIISMFSVNQLNALLNISKAAEDKRFENECFHSLSVNDVIHCATGKIITVNENGCVCECTEKEILESASQNLYKNWKNKKVTK